MSSAARTRLTLKEIDARLKTVLPPDYQQTYESLEPVPMRSAGLKFDANGEVAWNEIWGSFCDLAMAGGPPHKGKLLEPATTGAVRSQARRYREVADEITRGVMMAADLPADVPEMPGWIRAWCDNRVMAGWLLRAITMENVAVRAEGKALFLPAGPAFRLEKEIKNVVTVIAKTTHYWRGHLPARQQRAIETLFAALDAKGPLVEPSWPDGNERSDADQALAATMSAKILRDTGWLPSHHLYAGWLGVQCPSPRVAIWMMRALVMTNVLARREEHVLLVPLNAPQARRVTDAVAECARLAEVRGQGAEGRS